MPKVSVLMNCYNGEKYLREAIDSVYAQSFTDWEIIFIDNGSTDKSAEIAKEYDTRLKYYRINNTIPLYEARNVGLQQVLGNFITILDVDDIWHPNKLSKQLGIMDQYPEVYLVCSGFVRKNEPSGSLTPYKNFGSNFISFAQALRSYPICLSSVMLRKNLYSQNIIKFKPELNLTGDYELFIKLIYQFSAYYIHESLVTLRIHDSSLSNRLADAWPIEMKRTHDYFINELSPSPKEVELMEERYIRVCAFLYLANKKYTDVRRITKKYIFNNLKFLILYLSSFNVFLSRWVLKMRGRGF